MRGPWLAGAMLIVLLLSACGTIFTGTSETIIIKSEPNGARVYMNGRYLGTAPVATQVAKSIFANDIPRFAVEKDGYRRQEFQLSKEFNTVAVMNSTFAVSWTTDAFSGGVIRYSPTEYLILLEKERGPSAGLRSFALQRYVYFTFDEIKKDLARGYGEYLENLLLLAGTSSERDLKRRLLDGRRYRTAATPREFLDLLADEEIPRETAFTTMRAIRTD